MEPILKAFSFGFMFRNLFSGIFFVIAYYVAGTDMRSIDLTEIEGKWLLEVALPTSIVAGVTVYGIHRALLYPTIGALLFYVLEWVGERRPCKGWIPMGERAIRIRACT